MFKEQLTTMIDYNKIKNKLGVVMVFKISTIISLITLLTLTIIISILSVNSINHFFNITTTGWQFYSIKIYLILIFCLLLVSSILLCIISWIVKTDDIDKNIIIVSILAIFSVNPVALIFNLVKHYQWQKTETFAVLKARWWVNFKLAFGIKRWLIITLSGGQQQKINILLALIVEPDLLILDELATGLDLEVRERIYELLEKEVFIKPKLSVLIVSHNMQEIKRFCQQIIFMFEGAIISINDVKKVVKEYGSVEEYVRTKFKEYKIGMYDSEALLKRLGSENNEKWAKSWKKHLKKQK